MTIAVPSHVKSATLEAVVIRADGTREDLGIIARYDRPTGLKGILLTLKGLLLNNR